MSQRALILLTDGFEEIEAIAPIDLMRRAGIEVTLATPANSFTITGKTGVSLNAETSLETALSSTYDALVLPGGPGAKALRNDATVIRTVQDFYGQGKLIAAICAAPTILHQAGILTGHSYTAHFSVREELPAIIEEQPVVTDRNIITSRGAGTAIAFGLEIIACMLNRDEAATIAQSICVPPANQL